MSSIPNFQASLIQNGVNTPKTTAPSVEEILERTPSAPQLSYDTPEGRKNSGIGKKLVTAAVALTALGLAGRYGLMGKSVQKFLGKTPKLSQAQIQERISAKINEYVARTGDVAFDIKTLKNGKTRASRVLSNGQREIITFDPTSGLPEFRVVFDKTQRKKALNYVTFKGPDILDEGFDTTTNFYKKFSRSKIKHRHWIGKKTNNTTITYGNMVKAETPTVIKQENTYYRNGQLSKIYEENTSTGAKTTRDMLYDKNNKKQIKGLDIISSEGAIIRKQKGELPAPVNEPNRKNSTALNILGFFGGQKRNLI